jgi:hypothetical protein
MILISIFNLNQNPNILKYNYRTVKLQKLLKTGDSAVARITNMQEHVKCINFSSFTGNVLFVPVINIITKLIHTTHFEM